jgi:hypothetical protein
MKNAFVLAMMLSFAACATSADTEEETAPSTPSDEKAEVAAPAPAAKTAVEHQFCEPGPPNNWCQNRVNKACSSEGLTSRCYIPNYCEWGMVQCQSGIWVLIDPS